jgi:hypothetical protein
MITFLSILTPFAVIGGLDVLASKFGSDSRTMELHDEAKPSERHGILS